MPLLVLRPQPGHDATAAAARDLGIEVISAPLFTIEPVAWDAPPPHSVDALLIGSANAIRHAGPALAAYAGKPVHAVGESTAQAARAAGFAVTSVGTGGLQRVLEGITGGRLLRLAGEERLALTPPSGVSVTDRVVYAARPLPMRDEVANIIRAQPPGSLVAALHSAAAASHLGREMTRLDLPRGNVQLLALGPRIAAAAGEGWAAIHTCPAPDERSLLALAAQLCHTPPPCGRD
ncbi:MAG: uroporphyrinogen-III synthase [Sphingomonadales bacterium]|nr:uroporphyrinogen-III synthase [Sphingomonadales bacterium]MDE2169701.1 uroporphyrinogen-III synthase [Sphingomonadales bacterium]